MLSGMAAKSAGRGKSRQFFEIAGQKYLVGSQEHENLIREAIKQKFLQNPKAAEALKNSCGTIAHIVPGHSKPIFKMEKMLMSVRDELWGQKNFIRR
ncbi:MAG: hypothetical protein FJ147_27720 [Deltaproteobacteria bacterium]|nr:hypothetical protein [Deltaproteobacteria bacterium]